MLTELDNTNISVHLGKSSEYKSTYDPSLLVREPRQSNRKHLNIDDDNLPFVGYDIWNAYEFSCLCENGTPLTGIAKVVYPSSSKYIVESKSIKLYFNSFNMQKYTGNIDEIIETVTGVIENDLSQLLETDVKTCIFLCKDVNTANKPFGSDYITIENTTDTALLKCSIYKETPNILKGVKTEAIYETKYHSSLLKSNCRVTSQPDWGDVYIYYKGEYDISKESLLKYIVSFRDECHFHEEICETIYKRIWDLFSPLELCVTCLYVRRGGIDINPTRASHVHLLDNDLINKSVQFTKTLRQ